MTPLDKCPVCGGEIVEREVEKILRGGNLRKIVKAQAEVCLRCGERLYAPDVVKRFKKIRLKLQKEATTNAPNKARARLLNKLDYEIWFLDFLEERYEMVRGKHVSKSFKITGDDKPDEIGTIFEERVGLDPTLMNAMMPLTFIASYKTLDMIFEWVLEENCKSGNIQTIPWQFDAKVKLLNKNLKLPALFKSQPHLYTYSKALFCQLLPYRNEVIHKNSFSVSGDILTLSSSRTGTTLNLNSEQVGCLVRFVCALVRALTKEIVVDSYTNKLLQYYLDILVPVHGLAIFNQQMPRFVHVKLEAPRCGAAFSANLKKMRDKVVRTYSTDVIFDLTVLAMEGERLIAKWYFAPGEVPDLDVMTFYEESHKTHRVALVESETIKA